MSCSLRDGEGADEYVAELEKVVAPIGEDDEVIVMGDIIGGSPLTNALNVLAGRGLLAHTRAFGGVSLPMALTAAFDLQSDDPTDLCASALSEGLAAMREVELDLGGDDEDEEL